MELLYINQSFAIDPHANSFYVFSFTFSLSLLLFGQTANRESLEMPLVEPKGHIRSHFLTLIHTLIFYHLLKTFLPSCLVLMKNDAAGVLVNLTQCWAFVFICSCESTWFKARCSPHEDHSGRDSCLILVCMCGREREREKWQITLLITLDRATKDLESKTRKDRYVGGVALRLNI